MVSSSHVSLELLLQSSALVAFELLVDGCADEMRDGKVTPRPYDLTNPADLSLIGTENDAR
jgi:hypothetical protein